MQNHHIGKKQLARFQNSTRTISVHRCNILRHRQFLAARLRPIHLPIKSVRATADGTSPITGARSRSTHSADPRSRGQDEMPTMSTSSRSTACARSRPHFCFSRSLSGADARILQQGATEDAGYGIQRVATDVRNCSRVDLQAPAASGWASSCADPALNSSYSIIHRPRRSCESANKSMRGASNAASTKGDIDAVNTIASSAARSRGQTAATRRRRSRPG